MKPEEHRNGNPKGNATWIPTNALNKIIGHLELKQKDVWGYILLEGTGPGCKTYSEHPLYRMEPELVPQKHKLWQALWSGAAGLFQKACNVYRV